MEAVDRTPFEHDSETRRNYLFDLFVYLFRASTLEIIVVHVFTDWPAAATAGSWESEGGR